MTGEQARTISSRIVPSLEYLRRLHERMRRRGFPADDPLMSNVMFALEAMRQFRAGLHEIECCQSRHRLRASRRSCLTCRNVRRMAMQPIGC